MAERHSDRAFGLVLTLAVILTGCTTGGATASTTPTPTSAVEPSVSIDPSPAVTVRPSVPSATALPSAVAYGRVTVVEGTSIFVDGGMGDRTTDASGDRHARNGTFTFRDEMNDPRVSGTHTSTDWAMDFWGAADQSSGAVVQWGTDRIVNAGGSWEGPARGIWSSDRGDLVSGWFRGAGAYEGLTYFMFSDPQVSSDGVTSVYRIRGLIFPGGPPPR